MNRTRLTAGIAAGTLALTLAGCAGLQGETGTGNSGTNTAEPSASSPSSDSSNSQAEAAQDSSANGEESNQSESADSSEPNEPSETEAAEPEPSPEAEADLGSRDNPYPIGNPVSNDDWQVVLDKPHEAWKEIHAENEFNDLPPHGMQYWILPMTVTYTGSESAMPSMELDFTFVGDDARTYDDNCGVIPNDLMDVADLYEGGSAKANVCVAVPKGAHGLWTVAAFGTPPVFFDAGEK